MTTIINNGPINYYGTVNNYSYCTVNNGVNEKAMVTIDVPIYKDDVQTELFTKVNLDDYISLNLGDKKITLFGVYPFVAGKFLHQHIIPNVQEGYTIDHIDRKPLNNLKSNLRQATIQQQLQNRDKFSQMNRKQTSSNFKGVCFDRNRWKSYIQHKHIGYFTNEEDAARAYDKEAKELFGEFAVLNFPE